MGYFFWEIINNIVVKLKAIKTATSDVKHSSIPFKGRELPLRKLFETQTQDKPFELKYSFELRYTNFTNFWHILLNWDILILMYKVKNSLAPEHICNMFFQQDKHYNLRSDFPVPRYNTVKYGKHSIRYLGPHIWGKISQELRSKTSLQAFRRGVRALNVLGLLDGTCGCCACSS